MYPKWSGEESALIRNVDGLRVGEAFWFECKFNAFSSPLLAINMLYLSGHDLPTLLDISQCAHKYSSPKYRGIVIQAFCSSGETFNVTQSLDFESDFHVCTRPCITGRIYSHPYQLHQQNLVSNNLLYPYNLVNFCRSLYRYARALPLAAVN